MPTNNYQIKRMARGDLDIAIDWAAAEGWNPGLYDGNCFYDTDPHGFFMGFLNEIPISSISAVSYDKYFGFIGFYIVRPDYQGQGYGLQIWNKAINYLKAQNIGLDGVLSQKDNYKKSGFKLAYRNIRYQGKASGRKVNYKDIVKLSTIPFEQLTKYDNQLFSAPRPKFLRCWISQPEGLSVGALHNSNLAGYGVIRKCRIGFKIGPLFADNESIAEKLFQTMNGFVDKGTQIFLDVPEINQKALALIRRYNMKMVFETARMYNKQSPQIPLDKIFGVTSFELG